MGLEYVRRDIHERLGGQSQGGISTPKQQPVILLFTGLGGERYGYRDQWIKKGRIFLYTGEGQRGDMDFVRGNAAIREHQQAERDVHLFEETTKSGTVRYLGQMIYIGHRLESLAVESSELEPEESLRQLTLDQLRRAALQDSAPTRDAKTRLTIYRRRSVAIKMFARARAQGVCEGCESPAPFLDDAGEPFLEVHHVRRLSDGGPDHPDSVVAICPNCHRRAHHGGDRTTVNERLKNVAAAKETQRG